jgi:hypothetical protein
MNRDLLEKVEYLRSKANISYEEAVSLLERFDEDMTRVLVELERSGRIRKDAYVSDAEPQYTHEGHNAAHHAKYHRHATNILTFLFKNHLELYRNNQTLVNLPVVFYLLFLFAPYLFFPAVILVFLFGCRIRHHKDPGTVDASNLHEDVSQFARNTAENIRSTVSSVSQTFRQERAPRDDDKGSDEGGEITIE